MVLTIMKPKTRRSFGRRQFAIIEDEDTIAWIKWWCEGRTPKARLFPGSKQQLRDILLEACKMLGIESLGLTLAGLRTGGATHLFRRERNLGKLQFNPC